MSTSTSSVSMGVLRRWETTLKTGGPAAPDLGIIR